MDIRALAGDEIDELGRLFRCDRATSGCWCMWFIVRVKDYHDGGAAANEARFRALAAATPYPLGLVAWQGGEAVGWAAIGPRSRYARAVKTPTLRAIDQADNDAVWLVPCLFVRSDLRRRGIARSLVSQAVVHAARSGASALEAFPQAGGRLATADHQVGNEALFSACGFRVVDRPSPKRVLMRHDLTAA